jgi:hypothetical protein
VRRLSLSLKLHGKLLTLAAADFEAFLTVDKNLQYQQNLAILPLAIVVLDACSNELPALSMSVQPCTEDQLVEQPAMGFFAELGWTTISA